MTKQVTWAFVKFFFLQFDTKFASKQQRLAKIGGILCLLLSTQKRREFANYENKRKHKHTRKKNLLKTSHAALIWIDFLRLCLCFCLCL